mgnify:CR=1 FL=1
MSSQILVSREDLEAANAEIRRLREALERLGSLEAFGHPIDREKEVWARINFALDSLKPKS